MPSLRLLKLVRLPIAYVRLSPRDWRIIVASRIPATDMYDTLPHGFIRVLRIMPDKCPSVSVTERLTLSLFSANIPE